MQFIRLEFTLFLQPPIPSFSLAVDQRLALVLCHRRLQHGSCKDRWLPSGERSQRQSVNKMEVTGSYNIFSEVIAHHLFHQKQVTRSCPHSTEGTTHGCEHRQSRISRATLEGCLLLPAFNLRSAFWDFDYLSSRIYMIHRSVSNISQSGMLILNYINE